MDALVFQVGIAGPVMLALILHTLPRRSSHPAQRSLFWLLCMILAWMVGMVVSASDHPAAVRLAALLLLPPACFMAPLFCAMMLHYAGNELFEARRSVRWALMAPFGLFLLGFATDGWHGLMLGGQTNVLWASRAGSGGPLFWAFQVWSNAAALLGLAICARLAWRSARPDERRRMALLCGGVLLPLVVHALYTFRILPLAVPLTPSALAVTALLTVTAIRRYSLLDVQPVARRDVIEASGDAVLVADLGLELIDLNPAAAALLGAHRGELHGAGLAEVLARLEPVRPEELEALLAGLRGQGEPPRIEIETVDGRVLEASGGAPRDPSGARAGYFVVLRDRSSERRAERLLYQSQKLESVGSLAAGVAHEVNNPLAFVRANLTHLEQLARLLEEQGDELPKELAEESQEMPDVVRESIAGLDRIQEIVQGLLHFSRMPSGRVEPRPPNELVREAARFAALEHGSAVRLECELAEDLPDVRVCPDQLVQVLLNLFLNAKRATAGRPGAAILARTSRAEGGGVEIRVADNGPGVPDAIRERIFDPFFTTRPPNEGTGLGLSIACDIVSQHGGTLELEPSPLGGACFAVRLPVG